MICNEIYFAIVIVLINSQVEFRSIFTSHSVYVATDTKLLGAKIDGSF